MRITRYPRSRLLLVLTTWLLAVGVATAVGFGALRMIGNGVTDRASRPLSEQAVTSSAHSAAGSGNGRVSPSTPATSPTARTRAGSAGTPPAGSLSQPGDDDQSGAGTSPSGDDAKSFAIRGGTVFATCAGTRITLNAAYPMDGFRFQVSARGPEKVEVEFDDHDSQSRIALRCVSDVPTATDDGVEGGGGGGDR